MRGVTEAVGDRPGDRRISTRTPHAGSDGSSDDVLRGVDISTRTPHAGSEIAPKGRR